MFRMFFPSLLIGLMVGAICHHFGMPWWSGWFETDVIQVSGFSAAIAYVAFDDLIDAIKKAVVVRVSFNSVENGDASLTVETNGALDVQETKS